MTAGEFCNRTVVVATPAETARDVARRMKEFGVGTVVVVEEKPTVGRVPVGIVTDRDLVLRVLARAQIDADSCRVSSVMSADLVRARDDEDVDRVLARMRERGIRRIPVVNARGGLEGIIAYDDLAELLIELAGDLVRIVRNEQALERRRGGGQPPEQRVR